MTPSRCFSIANVDRQESRSFVIVFLKNDFMRFNVLIDRLLDAVVAGIDKTN